MFQLLSLRAPLLVAYILFVSALFGLVFGSFCNAWAWRLCHGESIAKGRSHCAVCGHTLAAKDLVPLLSWLILRGKCRYCGAPISKRYPLAELTSGFAFLSLVLRYSLTWDALRFCLLACFLLTVSLCDWETREIPDRLHIFIALTALLRLPAEGWAGVKSGLLGAVAVSVPLLLFVLLADHVLGRETMGGADIKLLAALGLHFSPALMLLLLIVACLMGILLALAARAGKGSEVPFGPAIALAAWLTALFGAPLLNWYLSLFF